MKSIGKSRDEVSEQMAGARKAMQQQQRLRVRRLRFAVENIEALDIGLPKADLRMTGLALAATTLAGFWIFKNRRSVIASQEVGFRDAPRPAIGTMSR